MHMYSHMTQTEKYGNIIEVSGFHQGVFDYQKIDQLGVSETAIFGSESPTKTPRKNH